MVRGRGARIGIDPAPNRRVRVLEYLSLILLGACLVGGAEAKTLSALLPADPCRLFGPLVVGSTATRLSCPQFGAATGAVTDSFAQSVGRSLPLITASAGFVYRYDPETAAFERETAIPGQLFLETTDTVGKGRWNLSLSYQRVKFDTRDGQDLDRLSDTRPPIALSAKGKLQGGGPAVTTVVPLTIPAFGVSLDTHQWTASAIYGATDDLDVNLTVPVVYSSLRIHFRFGLPTIEGLAGGPCGATNCAQSDSKLGVGDVFVRAKLRFLSQPWGQAAGGLILRLPAGNQDNFQGTGAFDLAPWLYATTVRFPLARFVSLQGYLNTGIDFDTEDVDRSEGRWGVGLDVGIAERATLAVAVLARYTFQRTGPPGVFDVARCPQFGQLSCARITRPGAPLFGLQNNRPDFYDLSTGLRVNLWRDTVIAFANALIALNDDGLRASVIPLVGVEATF